MEDINLQEEAGRHGPNSAKCIVVSLSSSHLGCQAIVFEAGAAESEAIARQPKNSADSVTL
jgi:hypothetical protein